MKIYLWIAVALTTFLLLWFPPVKDRLSPQRWEYVAPFQRSLFSKPPQNVNETRIDFPRLIVGWLAIVGPLALLVSFHRQISEWVRGGWRTYKKVLLIFLSVWIGLLALFAIGKIIQNYEKRKSEAVDPFTRFDPPAASKSDVAPNPYDQFLAPAKEENPFAKFVDKADVSASPAPTFTPPPLDSFVDESKPFVPPPLESFVEEENPYVDKAQPSATPFDPDAYLKSKKTK